MQDELEKALADVGERRARARKLRERIEAAETSRRRERKRQEKLHRLLRLQKQDVRQLKTFTFRSLVAGITGSKEEQLKKEREEVLRAKLKYDESCELLSALDLEIRGLKKDLHRLGDVDREYEGLMRAKSRRVRKEGGQAEAKLLDWTEKEIDLDSEKRELDEAIQAGQKASKALAGIVRHLQAAREWGEMDVWGSRGFSQWGARGKFRNLDRAKRAVAGAQRDLTRFRDELADVGVQARFKLRMAEFSRFADYFFDHFVIDFLAQRKIKESLDRVRETRREIRYVLIDLKKRRKEIAAKREGVKEKRRRFLERR